MTHNEFDFIEDIVIPIQVILFTILFINRVSFCSIILKLSINKTFLWKLIDNLRLFLKN